MTSTIQNFNLVTKVKVENYHSQLKSHITKTVIDFNFGRHKDFSTLKSDIHLRPKGSVNIFFSDRYILMSTSLKSITV